MARFKKGKRGTIINKHGVKITKKEQAEIKKLAKEVNKVRDKLNKELSTEEINDIFKNLGIENPISISRRSGNLHQFTNRGLLEAWKKNAKKILKNPQKYLDMKKEQFRENYLKAMEYNYATFEGESSKDVLKRMPKSVKDLYKKIKNASADEFYNMYLRGEIPEMNDNYIPSDEYERQVEDIYAHKISVDELLEFYDKDEVDEMYKSGEIDYTTYANYLKEIEDSW